MRMYARPNFALKHSVYSVSLRFVVVIFLLSVASYTSHGAAVTLVQHAGKDAGTTTSSTLAFASTNTAGNWIGVVIRAGALNETISVSDTRGNSYKKALQFNQTVDGFTTAIFYAENISSGTNSVTVSDSISGTLRFVIYEYSGVATVNSLDTTATAQGHSTTPATASVNTTANGDLLLATVMTGNGQSFTAGSGYKIEDNLPNTQNSKLMVEDQIQSSAGATIANATMGTTDDWGAGLAAFKSAGGTGGAAPTITNLNPNSGGAGTSVIITGTNFLSTQAQGNSTVKFNGVQTTPTAWSDTSITAPAPSGATTGNVVVNVNGVNSNGVLFTVPAPPSVTINQAAGQADPTSSSPVNFTAVFSTAVTGFSNSGVNLSGTAGATTAVVTGSGATYNVAVSGMTQNGTVIATIPAGVASANGLQNTTSTSTDNTVTYSTTVPSVALVQHASKDAGTTTSSTLAFASANTAGNWIGVVVRAGALNENITVSDSLGNSYKKALQFNQSVDGFSAAIFYAENISGGTNTVTVSDNISGSLRFVISEYAGIVTVNSLDVTATATGNGTAPSTASVNTTANGDLLLGAIMTGNPENFTAGSGYKIEDSVPALPGSKLVVEDQVQASAGATIVNATMGTADDWGAALAAFKAANGTGGSAPTISNLNPNSGAVGTSVVITGTNFLTTQAQGNSTVKFNGVTATPTAWSATSITAPVPSGATTGNVIVTVNGAASNGVSFTVFPPPTVTINQAAGQADPTNGSTINFTAVFSAAVTGFSNAGVTLSGTAGATTAVVTGSGTTYNVAVSGMTQTGTVIATIPAGVASANGVSNTASTSTDNTVTYDITPPSVTVNQAASQPDPASSSPINFTAVFSKTVTGFSNASVTLSGTAGATTAVVTGSGTTYNVAVSGMTQTGTVIATIPAGKAKDSAGNFNTASTSTDNTVTYNVAAPSVTINQAAGQANPTNTSPINFTAVFSTAVTGFSNSGVNLSGTAGATTVAVTGSGTTYNVAVSGMTQTGTVIATIPAGVASANGSFNTASTSTNNTVTYDITPPSVTVNVATSQANPTSTSPVNFTALFSKTVTGFSNSGVSLSGTAGATTAVVTGSGTTYNIAVSGMTQTGTVIASIPAGKAADSAGNLNTASTSTNNTVTFNFSALAGPVAAYSFEEGTGTTTADSSGNNNTGTLSTGVTWTAGKSGNAVFFNGTSGDITINDSNSLDLNGSFTVSAWVKPSTVAGTGTLLIKENTSGCGYFVQIVNGEVDSGFNNGSGCIEHITSGANLAAGAWYYITVALDHSSNTYNTYVNGVLIASTTETGVPVPNTQSLVFGRTGCSSCGFERYNGVLDEVRIYNRAQSTSEIQSIYSGYIAGPTITGLNPTSGTTGTPVTITGANFGSTQAQGNSTVKFNGVTATPTAWSATSITAPVPSGATTGSVVVTVNGNASSGVPFTVTNLIVTVSPKRAAVTLTQPQQFTATVSNDPANGGVSWFVDGVLSGNATVGTVSATGLYTPGTQPGVHSVTATSNSNTSVSATATVGVTDLAGVFTNHNDNARTGQNLQEYALNTSNVNSGTFGALFTCSVDGYLYAEPLYVANLNIGGQMRNVAIIATEHDSVYAFDADSPSCVQLWQTSFLSSGVTTVAPSDVNELVDLTPEIGITSTPVIDPASNTVYVFSKTKETVGTGCSTGNPCFVHKLHALDLMTGAEKLGGPVVFTAPNFDPLIHLQRAALLLNNGTVYIAIGSHGDHGNWEGWMTAYDATTLAQKWVYHATDPTSGTNNGGGIWLSGNGPSVDANGNIYVQTGNGNYDGVKNFADSVIKVSPSGTQLDYFTPFNQQVLDTNDIDLGSANAIVLPDSVGSATHPHLAVSVGKPGVIYLLDQNNMGQFNAAADQVVGEVAVTFNTTNFIGGFFGQPVYWNGNIYAVAVGDALRQFSISNATISSSSLSQSPNTYPFRAGTPALSASGTTNGIVWMVDVGAYNSNGAAILYAYDATNLANLLFSSPSSGAGAAPLTAKFTVPLVANGKVYVGGRNAFTVFGLLPN